MVYARLARWTPEVIHNFEQGLVEDSLHPRDAKMSLAKEITRVFYGDEAAIKAQEQFVTMFQQGNLPDEMPEYSLKDGDNLIDILVSQGMVQSRGDARRLVDQNGVKFNGETVEDINLELKAGVLQVGKRKFLRLK